MLKEKQLPATKYNKLGLLLLIIKDSSVPKITGFGVNPKGIVLPQIPPAAFLWTSCWKPPGGIFTTQSHLHPPGVGLGFSSPEKPKFLRTRRSPERVSKRPNSLHLAQTPHIQGILVELKSLPVSWHHFGCAEAPEVYVTDKCSRAAIWRVVTKLPIILSQKFISS